MANIKIDKKLQQKSSEQVDQELLNLLTHDNDDDGEKGTIIKLGIAKDETTNFEFLICPYCHNSVAWEDFYNDIDTMSILDTDAAASGSFTCPQCSREMRVFLDVLIHAEKMEIQ